MQKKMPFKPLDKENKINRRMRVQQTVLSTGDNLKKIITYKLFWGRSSLYKNIIHVSVFLFTAILAISGFSANYLQAQNIQTIITPGNISYGNIDLLEQGGSVESVLAAATTANFRVIEYTVKEGDTPQSIADAYRITKESLKLSNTDTIDYYADTVKVGSVVTIPEINGILIKVKEGDTLDELEKRLQKGNRLDIIEINKLKAPDYSLTADSLILVPDGLVAPPPPPVYYPPQMSGRGPSYSDIYITQNVDTSALSGIAFIDPLSHPSCAGYSWSRGFSSWHNAVDLAKFGGCEVRAAAAGTVTYAGWEPYGGGYAITIDHGNGIQTVYYHAESLYVKTGDYVSQGQGISYMGCTGLCTGTHLHFGLRINYVYIDSSPYVPYYRP